MSTGVATLPRRFTAAKQQELISRNQFAERLIRFGWMPHVPEDLGEDFIVHVYFEGRATGVVFHVQIKSVINLDQRRRGEYVGYDDIKVKDLKHWESFSYPVVLVIWDIGLREGRWILVDDAIAYLDQRRPNWREQDGKVTVHLPWRNTTDEQGLLHLRRTLAQSLMSLLLDGKPLKFTLTLKGDASVEPAQMQQALGDWLVAGGELSNKHFKEAKLRFDPPEFGRWIGDIEFEDFHLTATTPVSKHQVQLTVLDGRGQSLIRRQIEVERRHKIEDGQHTIEFANAESSQPVVISLSVPITQLDPIEIGPGEFSWHVQDWGQDAVEALEIARFWRAWDIGKSLCFDFNGADGRLEFAIPAHPASDDRSVIELGMQQLCLLQQRLGQRFQVPADGPGATDLETIGMLAMIVEQGKYEHTAPKLVISMEGSFDRAGLAKLVDLYETQEDADFRVSGVFGEIDLLGRSLDLGPATRHIHGRIDSLPEDIGDLIRRAPVEASLRIGLVDVTLIDIYPDWFKREAERLAHLLIEEIGSDAVYLFGSIAWGGEYAPDTDIDLAVKGLDSLRFLDAIQLVEQESDFPVDLVDIDKIPDQLRDRIITSGVMLNGSK